MKKRKKKIKRRKWIIKIEKKRIPVKWWDIECDQVIKRRKDKLKEFSDKCDIKSFIEFKKARTIATKTI